MLKSNSEASDKNELFSIDGFNYITANHARKVQPPALHIAQEWTGKPILPPGGPRERLGQIDRRSAGEGAVLEDREGSSAARVSILDA